MAHPGGGPHRRPGVDRGTVLRRLHFDTVARLYEAARPGYPTCSSTTSCGSPGFRRRSILDAGCGTGKSTEPFARRGFSVCALDPGANMLAVCEGGRSC